MAFLQTFESYLLDNRLMKSSDFHKALRYIDREDEEDDATAGVVGRRHGRIRGGQGHY